jgi:hypothetical protein
VQPTRRTGRAILAIDIEQLFDSRPAVAFTTGARRAAARQSRRQRVMYSGQSLLAEAEHAGESPVMRCRFELFQRTDVQLLVNSLGSVVPIPGTEVRMYRVALSPQPISIGPTGRR